MRLSQFLILGSLCLAAALPCSAIADDEEPSVRGKKASEWLSMLGDRDPQTVKQRRTALVALSILGPKVPGVVPGLATALKQDPDEDVRIGAGQTLGQM